MSQSVLILARWPVGGVRTYLRYVYSAPAMAPWHYTLVAPETEETWALKSNMEALGVEVVTTGNSAKGLFSGFLRELWRRRPALVHSHGLKSALLAAIPVKLMGARHVVTLHDVFHDEHFSWVWRWGIGLLLSLVDVVQTVSEGARENLIQFLPDALSATRGKVIAIQNGIDAQRFLQAAPMDLRARLGLPADCFMAGFLGRFMGQKGFRYVVEAVDLLHRQGAIQPGRFALVAIGDGGFIREDRAKIEAGGLEPYFHFLPFMDDVGAAIKGLDVVVMPSLWEACPLLPMETLVSGTPIICTPVIGLAEVVADTPAIMVPERDGVALAEAIHGVWEASPKQRFMDYVQEAAQRFDREQCASKLSAVYRRLTA